MTREGLQQCPHCGEVTMANRLPDGSLVCSCPAMRPLGPIPHAGMCQLSLHF